MLEELADTIVQHDMLFLINTEGIPRTIFDVFRRTYSVAAKLYVKPEKFEDLYGRLASLSHEGLMDEQAIESLKNKIGGKPKVSIVGNGQMDVGEVCIPETYQDLLHILADKYSVGILADPSIRPVDSAVHPQTIPGFKEYGMLWLDQNTRISAGTRERYIGLGPIKIKWFPKKMTAPSVRLTEASDYGDIPNPEYAPAPVQIFPIEPKS